MTLTPAQRILRESESEAHFLNRVVKLAELRGWLVYHTFNSQRSAAGFPDLVMARGARVIFAELKATRGRLSSDQQRWWNVLRGGDVEVYLWRPSDDEEIARVLM